MRMRSFGSLLALFLLAPSPLAAEGLPDLGDTAQLAVSPQTERRVGEAIMRDFRLRDPSYSDDAEVTAYLNAIGYRLVSNSQDARQEFEFFLVKDPALNAFALPGGYIGVHSGLIVAAQSESELAAVLAHEIAHVTQRHVARMVDREGQISVALLAAMALAIISRNSELGSAAATIGQAGAITAQIGFTREFEREADRLGFLTLEKSGFDVRALPAFFLRMQQAGRLHETNAPAYLRSHPVSTERIADAENRIQGTAYVQTPDSLDFQLVRAKLNADRGTSRDALERLENALREGKFSNAIAARYGFAAALLRAKELARAEAELAPLLARTDHPMLAGLSARIQLAKGDTTGAAETLKQALARHPHNRALSYAYADALQQLRKHREAIALLQEQIRSTPRDARLYALQARSYAALGKRLLQYQARAEGYALQGNLSAAVEQMELAQKTGDGDFYQLSSVDARLRQLRLQLAEQMKQSKERK